MMFTKTVSRSPQSRVAATRVPINVYVDSRTIGTETPYRLSTVNASKSGMLLSTSSKDVPFRVNTIIEMTIDPLGSLFNEPVQCLAKVVRVVTGTGSEKKESLGVQILELDNNGCAGQWDVHLSQLETALGLAA